MGCKKQKSRIRVGYLVSSKSFLYPWHSLHMGFPLYFGFPSLIFRVPLFTLQIQQSAMIISKKLYLIKIYHMSKKDKFKDIDLF